MPPGDRASRLVHRKIADSAQIPVSQVPRDVVRKQRAGEGSNHGPGVQAAFGVRWGVGVGMGSRRPPEERGGRGAEGRWAHGCPESAGGLGLLLPLPGSRVALPPPFPSACALPGPGGPQAQQHPLPSVQSFHWSFHPGVHLLPPPEQSLPTGQDTLPAPDQDTLFNPPTRLPDPSR